MTSLTFDAMNAQKTLSPFGPLEIDALPLGNTLESYAENKLTIALTSAERIISALKSMYAQQLVDAFFLELEMGASGLKMSSGVDPSFCSSIKPYLPEVNMYLSFVDTYAGLAQSERAILLTSLRASNRTRLLLMAKSANDSNYAQRAAA